MEEILIIDDSRPVTEFLTSSVLPYHQYRARVASTGAEGLAFLKQRSPDLILLDLQLPDCSGLDLLRRMREEGYRIPVILMTAHGSEQTAVEAFRLGARNYLIKPFPVEDGIAAIENALREQRLQREKEQLHRNLEQRVKELTVLSAIGKSVTALLHIEELLDRIVEAGVYLTHAEEGLLLLADSQSKELYLRAAKNIGDERVRHMRLPLEDSLAGNVMRTLLPQRLDAQQDRTLSLRLGYSVNAVLQVPLLVGRQAVGVLGVHNRQSQRPFSENDQYLLSALADYAAIALENARLFQQVSTSLQELEIARRALDEERQKAERLLLNILPQSIAERLKHDERTIADSFSEASVLFADIVDFTRSSASISPSELVGLLNEIFSSFDRLVDRYGLEKIKTIGDAYMVVGGLPTPRPDHAEAIAAMALAMQQEIARFKVRNSQPFSMRIGISTGPVVAGVIGAKKFSYDLWGDTVNVASRMERQGVAGRIQVTAAFYERLRDLYLFEERGVVHIKGRGEMRTYFLTGQRPGSRIATARAVDQTAKVVLD